MDTKTKNSFAAFKGHVTRNINNLNSSLANCTDLSEVTDFDVDKIKRLSHKLENSLDKLEECLVNARDHLNDDDYKTINTDFNKLDGEVSTITDKAAKLVRDYSHNSDTYSVSTTTRTLPQKINEALKPEKLLASATLAEYRSWQTNFELYYSSNKMDKFPLPEQQGYLRSCIELKLQQVLSTKITNVTPIHGDGNCLSALKGIFLQNIPLLTRRYNFFKCNQIPGEKFSDWNLRLQLEGQEAELDKITEDDLYALRYVTGTADKKLREEFLRQNKTTREDFQKIAMSWESATAVEENLSSSNSSLSCSKVSSYQKSKKSQMARPCDSKPLPQSSSWTCYRCDDTDNKHTSTNGRCKGIKALCFHCGKTGHTIKVCQQ